MSGRSRRHLRCSTTHSRNPRYSPYAGVGVNYTLFYGEGGHRNPAVTGVNVSNAGGVAFNAGLNVEITPNWLLNLDVKFLSLRTSATVDTVLGRINANANVNPWVLGAGVRYRF
jgi:outer membrane protein